MQEVFNSPIFQVLFKTHNPQNAINNILNSDSRIANNSIAQNALKMANSNDTAGLENMARNLCKERGWNPDQIKNEMLKMFQ